MGGNRAGVGGPVFDKHQQEEDFSTSWADQWDYAGDAYQYQNSKSGGGGAGAKNKVISAASKAKSAASVGAKKIKAGSRWLISHCPHPSSKKESNSQNY